MRPIDIEQAPDHHLVSGKLTAKQRKFAREVAMGATKADAYRSAYKVTSPASLVSNPYNLAADSRIKREIEAIRTAIEAEHIKQPAALRALVIQNLVSMATDPDVKDATRLKALKLLGDVSEVGAFTTRTESKIITSSEDARARVLDQLRSIVKADATDAELIERDAESLLAELAPAETHPGGTPQSGNGSPEENMHTIPHERLSSESIPHEQSQSSLVPDPTLSPQEHPPS